MSKFNVAVAFSRPVKNGNRKEPFPQANADFVLETLQRVRYDDYGYIAHTATDYGVDAMAESFAQKASLKQRQYPAYWFDVTKENKRDKAAGIKAKEQMVRDLTDSLYNKDDHYAMLLVFHTGEDPRSDEGLKSLLDFVAKYHPMIQVRTFRLPVTSNPKVEEAPATEGMVDLSPTSGIPDPFMLPQ